MRIVRLRTLFGIGLGMVSVVWTAAVAGCIPATPPNTARQAPPPLPEQRFSDDKLPASDSESPGQRQQIMAALGEADAYLEQALKDNRLPGLAVGVVFRGQTIWSTGLGQPDLEQGGTITPQTVFRIGSVTKTLTGLALLMLRDEGKLALDDPLVKHLPEASKLVYPTKDNPRITLRHLVTHTSGLPRIGKLDYYSRPNRSVTEKELLDGLDGLKLSFSPGTRTVYSNLAMGLAGVVVGRVAGMPYRQFVSERLLRPLGMTGSCWDRQAVPAGKLATGYRRQKRMLARHHHWRLGAAEGLGGLYASLTDMTRFVVFQLKAWPPRNDPDDGPVRRSTVRESHLIAGFGRPDQQPFGINWAPVHHPSLGWVVTHTGGTFLYAASVWMLPERQLGLVMLTNTGGEAGDAAGRLSQMCGKMLSIILKAIPDRNATLTPVLDRAVTRVEQLLAAPGPAPIARAFAPSFLSAIPNERVLELLRRADTDLGRCADHRPLRRIGPHAAVVELVCEKGTAELTVHVEESPPHRFTAFGIGDIKKK